jgi:hypothetical protein
MALFRKKPLSCQLRQHPLLKENAALTDNRYMATQRQIEANRKNAKRSTGPKTTDGKAKVKYNALKHGLLADAALLPDEDEAAFCELSAQRSKVT